MTLTAEQINYCRRQFPAFSRRSGDDHVIYLDGPAGTQVPQQVIDAIGDYLAHHNANHGGLFATSRESDAILDRAHKAVADLLGTDDPGSIAFGANMTTLTFALSRALAKTWQAGDEIVVTRLEHDANFTPWVKAAEDAGATVQYVDINTEDCTLNLDDFKSKINSNTKLVAVGCASNAVGSINPVKEIAAWAHAEGALVFLDAVHYAPHALIDVKDWDCDFLVCSAYKFFGPHVGILYGKRALLESIEAYKLRPPADQLPDKWMTGTQNHECIAGVTAAINYLADLGNMAESHRQANLRESLKTSFAAIRDYESELLTQLLDGLAKLRSIEVFGITDPARNAERLPTVSIRHQKHSPEELAKYLGDCGIYTWHGNYYALPLTETIGVEPDGMVRLGLLHYNTPLEIERLLSVLAKID